MKIGSKDIVQSKTRSLQAGVEPNVVFESRTPHTLLAMVEKGARYGNRSLCSANRSLSSAHRPRDLQGQTLARALGALLGQAAPPAVVRHGFLRNAGASRARSVPDFAAVRTSAQSHGATLNEFTSLLLG